MLVRKANEEYPDPAASSEAVWSVSALFVCFDSLRPINNLSVKQGRVFLGWTSTKLGEMCLAQGPQGSDACEARTWGPRSRVKHSTTKPLRSQGLPCLSWQLLFEILEHLPYEQSKWLYKS